MEKSIEELVEDLTNTYKPHIKLDNIERKINMIERYRLILKHEFVHDDGTVVPALDDPIVDKLLCPPNLQFDPRPDVVNEMIEQRKKALISRIAET